MRLGIVSILVIASCAKHELARVVQHDEVAPVLADAAPLPASTPDAAPAPPFANDANPDLRALGAALDALTGDDTAKWIADMQAIRPDALGHSPMPGAAQRAVDALVAWDGTGGVVQVECGPSGNLGRILLVGRAAAEAASSAGAPEVHAVLRFAQALRGAGNDPLALLFGLALARDTAERLHRRGLSLTTELRALGPDDAVVRQAAEAELACQRQALAKLGDVIRTHPDMAAKVALARAEMHLSTEDAVEADLAAAAKYIQATAAIVDHARSTRELHDALDARRLVELNDSGSVLAPIFWPYAGVHAFDELARYRAAVGR